MIIERIVGRMQRNKRAARMGVRYRRYGDPLPSILNINGEQKALNLPSDTGVNVTFYQLLLDDCYGLERLPRSLGKVLDIGANAGLFCVAARKAFPQATIHAYEPNPQLEPYLKTQAQATDAQIFMEAIGLESGAITLDFNGQMTETRSRPEEAGQTPQVAFREAIQRLGGSVDLVKADCEGAEWQFLRDHAAWQSVRHIALEYHLSPHQAREEAAAAVQNLGFVITLHQPTGDHGLILASRG